MTTATKTELFQEVEPGRKVAADVAEGCHSFQMSIEELTANIQVLKFSVAAYRTLGEDAINRGDEASVRANKAREEVASTLLSRFQLLAAVGEPKSRDVH